MNHLNMHETYRRWPLGTTSIGAWKDLYGSFFYEWHGSSIPFDDWLYKRLRSLLQATAQLSTKSHIHTTSWIVFKTGTVADLLTFGAARGFEARVRVTLLDGAVVREWGAL